jgi:hypothetical protein
MLMSGREKTNGGRKEEQRKSKTKEKEKKKKKKERKIMISTDTKDFSSWKKVAHICQILK